MNPCTEHYTPAACAAASCPNAWTGPITQQGTDRICGNCEQPFTQTAVGQGWCGKCLEAREAQRKRETERLRDAEPHGLARLDTAGLAELRAIILTVIDDGDAGSSLSEYDCCAACGMRRNQHSGQVHAFAEPKKPWEFAGEGEAATEARMRFVEAVTAAIIAKAKGEELR